MLKGFVGLLLGMFLAMFFSTTARAGAIAYTQIRHQKLKEKPAIVLCAFGTSTKAQVTFDFFEKRVREELPDYDIRWAFTSEVIREKMNRIFTKKGLNKRLYSLHEVLATLYAEGYRKVVVQPLHIFPGLEYKNVVEICERFPDLRIVVGEPLLFRWEYVKEVLEVVSKEFLPPEEGINILVAHGTGVTINGANITYLGLDWLVRKHYSNVLVGTVEGVPDAEVTLKEALKYPAKKVRFVPFMFVAGDHIMNDIMGKDLEDGEKSWREIVEEGGKEVDCVTAEVNGKLYYKGLGLYPEIDEFFVKQIKRALDILDQY